MAVKQNHLRGKREFNSLTMVMVLVNPAVSMNKGVARTSGISLMESATAGFGVRVWQNIAEGTLDIARTAEKMRVNRRKRSMFLAYPVGSGQ